MRLINIPVWPRWRFRAVWSGPHSYAYRYWLWSSFSYGCTFGVRIFGLLLQFWTTELFNLSEKAQALSGKIDDIEYLGKRLQEEAQDAQDQG